MKNFVTSGEWTAYFCENALTAAARRQERPPARANLPADARAVIAGSLPAWQLGETSEGNHLRAAARQYARAQDDVGFIAAVDCFIREEQRHGALLGEWLDAVGIPRKQRDVGDSLFRFCRYAIPNYAVWASVVVMVESMAEIYYAAVKRVSPCPRLKAECEGILRDEVKHIQFQCEHLAAVRRKLPRWLQSVLTLGEAAFYVVVCTAVWIAHGKLLRFSGMDARAFARSAAAKFRAMQRLMNPAQYVFAPESARPALRAMRISIRD